MTNDDQHILVHHSTVMSQPRSVQRASARGIAKTFLFWFFIAAIPVVVFGAAELSVRLLIDVPVAPDPYLNIGAVPKFFNKTLINGKPHYQVSHQEAYSERLQTAFPVEKSPGTIRIFCLGGSASAGWPHPKGEAYSDYLGQALQAAFPERKIEVLNVSGHAYASYRVRLIFDNIITYQPDLIIIYSGNNEFLEKRTYRGRWKALDTAVVSANTFAIFRLFHYWHLRNLHPESSLSGWSREHVRHEVFAKLARQALALRQDSVQLNFVKEHYRFNIEYMVGEAGKRKVPVMIVTVPVNLRDWHPNVSHNGLSGEDLRAWERAVVSGRRSLLKGEPLEAVRALGGAIEMEPLHAGTHFYRARALEGTREFEAAAAEYGKAKDLDYNPFRALSDFNRALREIAAGSANVHLADVEGALSSAAAPLAPGFDLFLDYVHPTRAGNLVIARAVFDTIVESGVLGKPNGERRFGHGTGPEAQANAYDEGMDYEMQGKLLRLFSMMHQYESLVEKARRYADVKEPGLRALVQSVLTTFPDYIEMDRDRIMGVPIEAARERRIKAGLQRFYGETFGKWGGREVTAETF